MLKKLVAWLPREAIRDNFSKAFIITGDNKFRVILDYAKVSIERSKALEYQAATSSDCKHLNTTNVLVSISPSGFITFLTSCYGGRESDKFITKDSGFYDLLERDDVVMTDLGFQIQEDLLLQFCNLQVPPGARAKSQMAKKEAQKPKEIANLWIHVETSTINRIKNY